MKKNVKTALLLTIFSLMISQFAFASFNIDAIQISECAVLMFQGIALISVGRFLKESVNRNQ